MARPVTHYHPDPADSDRMACGLAEIVTSYWTRSPLAVTCRRCRSAYRSGLAGEDLGAWRVARQSRQGAGYALRCQGDEASARAYFGKLDARQGAAVLLAPGQPLETAATTNTARQSGPNLRTRW